MLTTITCSTCDKDGLLPVEFKFTVEARSCGECHRINTKEFKFFFCDVGCFSAWFEDVLKKGVPCQDCRETGFMAGFESNGQCETCGGKGRVSETETKI